MINSCLSDCKPDQNFKVGTFYMYEFGKCSFQTGLEWETGWKPFNSEEDIQLIVKLEHDKETCKGK